MKAEKIVMFRKGTRKPYLKKSPFAATYYHMDKKCLERYDFLMKVMDAVEDIDDEDD